MFQDKGQCIFKYPIVDMQKEGNKVNRAQGYFVPVYIPVISFSMESTTVCFVISKANHQILTIPAEIDSTFTCTLQENGIDTNFLKQIIKEPTFSLFFLCRPSRSEMHGSCKVKSKSSWQIHLTVYILLILVFHLPLAIETVKCSS